MYLIQFNSIITPFNSIIYSNSNNELISPIVISLICLIFECGDPTYNPSHEHWFTSYFFLGGGGGVVIMTSMEFGNLVGLLSSSRRFDKVFLVNCFDRWNQWMWLVSWRRQGMLTQGPAPDHYFLHFRIH